MDNIFSANGYSIWVEGSEAGICDANGTYLIVSQPYDFVWLWRACCLAGLIPNLASIDLWKVVHATSRDEENPLTIDAKAWASSQLGDEFKLFDIMTENVPDEFGAKIVELIKSGWPIDVESTHEEIYRTRLVLPKVDRSILDYLYRFERAESIHIRYQPDVLAYLKHAKVEPGRIDHGLINHWLVEAVHSGCENSLGKDAALTIAIAMCNISWAFTGAAFTDTPVEEKPKIILRQIKKAARWVAGHYAKPIFWIWRKPVHSVTDLVLICEPLVKHFNQLLDEQAKEMAKKRAEIEA